MEGEAFRMNCGRGGFLARLLYEIREYVRRIGTGKGKGDYLLLSTRLLRRGFQRSISFFTSFRFDYDQTFFLPVSHTHHLVSALSALFPSLFLLPFPFVVPLALFGHPQFPTMLQWCSISTHEARRGQGGLKRKLRRKKKKTKRKEQLKMTIYPLLSPSVRGRSFSSTCSLPSLPAFLSFPIFLPHHDQ